MTVEDDCRLQYYSFSPVDAVLCLGREVVSVIPVSQWRQSYVFRVCPGGGGRRLLALPHQPLHQPGPHRRGAPRLPSPAQPSGPPSSGLRVESSLGRPLLPPLLWRRNLDTDLPRLLRPGPQVRHQTGGRGLVK